MYASTIGTFLQRDPLALGMNTTLEYSHTSVSSLLRNLLNYVGNRPLDAVDPSGLDPNLFPYPVFTRDPPLPVFPEPGTGAGPSKPNVKTWLGFNCGPFSCPTKKKDRLKPIPNLGTPPSSPPFGPSGGSNAWYGLPSEVPIGGGGADPCAIVVIRCPDGVAVYHFSSGDDPSTSLYSTNWTNCSAIVCGGTDEERESGCLHDQTLAALNKFGISLVGVAANSACGVNPDGSWYVA